ncbi:MAG: WYL domain-containing protein [Trueperaceae bacterium]|nr:WYL domain-containing protein [Trueperaceae bacterium]
MSSSIPKRLFRLVEELQGRGRVTAAELAERLGVSERTVRRDLTRLEELDLAVETWPGRSGGLSLASGTLLPALRFTDDELLALVLALGRSAGEGGDALERAASSALRRLDAVLSPETRARLTALSGAVASGSSSTEYLVPAPIEYVLRLAEAVHSRQRVQLSYDGRGEMTRRSVDPYGLARIGAWYLVGYCHLRQDLRTFRLDRMREVRFTDGRFERPAGFDAFKAVAEAIAMAPGHGDVVCTAWLDTDLHSASRMVPLNYVVLEPHETGVRLATRARPDDLERIVLHLLRLPCFVRIEGPPELIAAAEELLERARALLGQIAS